MGRNQKKNPQKQETAAVSGRRHFIALAILCVSIFLAYSNSINGTWAMDDVLANKAVGIKDLQDFVGARKVAYLTFLLNQYIAPFSPANFRLFNILIHILNSALVYMLAYRTILSMPMAAEQQTQKREDTAFYAALFSSVIFALHPINVNAVAYIVQRMASLAALFVLLSVLCYISAAKSANKLKAVFLYISVGIFIAMGIFSKENAAMAVPLIFLYDYVFLSRFDRRAFMKKVLFVAGIGALSLGLVSFFLGYHHVFIDLAKIYLNPNQPLTERIWMAVNVYWTPLQHVLTEFRVVTRYIFLIFFPLPQFLVFDWWGFPISKGMTEPLTTLFSMIFLLALFIFSVWKIKRFPLLCFGILWYLVAVSLESFLAVGADLYYEHRNYLPVSGLIIGMVGQSVVLFTGGLKDKTIWLTAAFFCILLGSLTFARNFVWKDSVTLWEDAAQKHPSNIRALISAGNAYLKVPDFDKAKNYYKEAVRLSDRDKRSSFLNAAVYRLGMTYLFEKDIKQAKRLIDTMEASIESYSLDILKGFYKASTGDIDGAVAVYTEVFPKTSGVDPIVVYTLMGDAYREKGMWDTAIEKYNNAIALDPAFAAAYYGIGVSYTAKRNLVLANDYFSKTLAIEPYNILALSDMAELMLIRKSKPEDALAYAQKAVSKSPPFYQPYLTMGNVLIVLGREKEADEFYNKAAERGMPGYMIPFSKARAFYIKGDRENANYYLSELQKYKLPEKFKGAVSQ